MPAGHKKRQSASDRLQQIVHNAGDKAWRKKKAPSGAAGSL